MFVLALLFYVEVGEKMEVRIRKVGNFYHVFDDDAYIFYYLFHYKIKDGKCGFPRSAYHKVIHKLEECHINYKDSIDKEEKDFKKKNNYQKYVDKGKRKVLIEKRRENILEEAKKLSEQEVDDLLKLMEKYICER